jgi:PAS domain S-box-containing protein
MPPLLLAMEAAGIGIFEVNFVDGVALGFKPAARQIFGFAPDAPMSPAMVDALVHKDDRAERERAQKAAFDPAGDGVYRATYRIRRANDGALRWISAHGQALFENGQVVRVVGFNRDITDAMNAAQVLQEKAALAERLSALASALPGAIYTYELREDGSGHMPYASPKIEDAIGFTPERLAQDLDPFVQRIDIDDLMPLCDAVSRAAASLSPCHTVFRYHHPQKGLVWIECESAPQVVDGGKVVWHGYLQDVTTRKNAEAALVANEKRMRAIFEAADDAIFTVDDGILTSLNPAGLRMFGYRSEDVIGGSVDRLMHDPARARHDVAFERARNKIDQNAPRVEAEILGRRGDGSIFPVLVSVLQIDCCDKPLSVGFARDLTAQRLNEARVQQMNDERLKTLESMAAGLAHEVNQPLAAGATYLKVARRLLDANGDAGRTGASPEVLRLLDKASAQIVRAGRIITRVREFSTRGEPDKTYQNLHQLISGVGKALSEDEKLASFRLLLRLNAENDRVIVDRMQISQVLVNLIRNAAQAMQSSSAQDIVVATSLDEENDIRVQVIDNGVGLSEETHKSLFEPFKTSKPRGMGVGLSISRAIVEAHFGKIWAEPNPGGGAIFSFSLPLAEQELP